APSTSAPGARGGACADCWRPLVDRCDAGVSDNLSAADVLTSGRDLPRLRRLGSLDLRSGHHSAVGIALAGKSLELVTLALLITLGPRRLGPGPYGDFALALSIVTFGSLALSLGGPLVLARFVPAAAPTEQAAVARALALRLSAARGAQVAIVGVVAAALA